jgi:uncharacterized protein
MRADGRILPKRRIARTVLSRRRRQPPPSAGRLPGGAVAGSTAEGSRMKQQVSLITLGVAELGRSRRFYTEGFGWAPVFANDEIIFYQMNGFVLATFMIRALAQDMAREVSAGPAAFALAHNVPAREDVEPAVARLLAAGGRLLRSPDVPPHGGFRGYVADPDAHAWEVAWNPAWAIDEGGMVTFGT